MSNETFEALPILALLLETTALGLSIWRVGAGPMMALNGLAAIGLAIPLAVALASGPNSWAEGLYAAIAALFAFELAVLATCLGWLFGRRAPLGVVITLEFAVHVLLTIAVAIFAFTFRINREF